MKNRLIALSIMMIAALTMSAFAASNLPGSSQGDDRDFAERDEIRQSYELAPNARVEVSGINGTVDIETSNTGTAEVYIVRSAKTREDLNYRKIIIEHTANSLTIRGEKERDHSGNRPEVRQRVKLRLPRQIDLTTSGVNGRVNVGEVDGPVRISGVNGRVEVAQAVGYSDLSGINGAVTVTIARLGERGIQVSGVNGRVELRFADNLDADLDVTGINGSVNADVPNVTLQGKMDRNNFRARIGAGGIPISISGVNGGVRLTRAAM